MGPLVICMLHLSRSAKVTREMRSGTVFVRVKRASHGGMYERKGAIVVGLLQYGFHGAC